MKNNKINHLENKNDKQQPLTETFCQRLKNIIDKNKIVYGLEKKKWFKPGRENTAIKTFFWTLYWLTHKLINYKNKLSQ